jgi:hypothetical protein
MRYQKQHDEKDSTIKHDGKNTITKTARSNDNTIAKQRRHDSKDSTIPEIEKTT